MAEKRKAMDLIEREKGDLRWLTCRALDKAGVVKKEVLAEAA